LYAATLSSQLANSIEEGADDWYMAGFRQAEAVAPVGALIA
jgi:hypothetical protein